MLASALPHAFAWSPNDDPWGLAEAVRPFLAGFPKRHRTSAMSAKPGRAFGSLGGCVPHSDDEAPPLGSFGCGPIMENPSAAQEWDGPQLARLLGAARLTLVRIFLSKWLIYFKRATFHPV